MPLRKKRRDKSAAFTTKIISNLANKLSDPNKKNLRKKTEKEKNLSDSNTNIINLHQMSKIPKHSLDRSRRTINLNFSMSKHKSSNTKIKTSVMDYEGLKR